MYAYLHRVQIVHVKNLPVCDAYDGVCVEGGWGVIEYSVGV